MKNPPLYRSDDLTSKSQNVKKKYCMCRVFKRSQWSKNLRHVRFLRHFLDHLPKEIIMKYIYVIALGLLSFSMAQAQSDAKLDLDRGTVRTCDSDSGDLGETAFRAIIKRSSDLKGGLLLKIKTQFVQCALLANGEKAWMPQTSLSTQIGNLVYNFENFRLIVSGDRGQLISQTNLSLNDEQSIRISAQQLIKIGHDSLIEVGASAFRHSIYNGEEIDQEMIFFGSYLVQQLF